MNTAAPRVNPIPDTFRAQLARAASDARLSGVPFSPLNAERVTVDGAPYALELRESRGLRGAGECYEVTITDLTTGQRHVYPGAWIKARRAQDGSVKHTCTQPLVGSHPTWNALTAALIRHAAQQWAQAVAA